MADLSVGSSTVSSDIQQLAAALMAPQRKPIDALQSQVNDLNQRSSVLGSLRTRMSALRGALDTLDGTGTLSPFANKVGSSSDPNILTASAAANAATGAVSVTVAQLARRATHASDLFSDTGTTISSGGTGTFAFTLSIAGVDYAASVTVSAGDTDKAVLDNVAAAITTALGGKSSAMRVQTQNGSSRLTVSSAATGTSNKITFADTDGLLARIGLYKATPTAATDTTGGYVYEDLGGHQLDAKLVVDGLTYYRDSNTVTDLLTGVTLNLKGISTAAVDVKIQPDAAFGLSTIKDFIAKYNDVLDYLGQNTFVDGKNNKRGILALDPVFSSLAGQLRVRVAQRVTSQAAGTADSLAALGIVAGEDGKLSITNETTLTDALTSKSDVITSLFNASDGVAANLETFVDGYAKSTGQITLVQNQISLRINGINARIDQQNAALARRQAILEDQLARTQAMLQELANQQAQINNIVTATG